VLSLLDAGSLLQGINFQVSVQILYCIIWFFLNSIFYVHVLYIDFLNLLKKPIKLFRLQLNAFKCYMICMYFIGLKMQ